MTDDIVLEVTVDESGIIHTALRGAIGPERIPALKHDIAIAKELVRDGYQKRGLKLKSLIDLSGFAGTNEPTAMSLLAEYMQANKPFVAKSALFGAEGTTKLAADVVSAIARREDLSAFKSKEDALAYLAHD